MPLTKDFSCIRFFVTFSKLKQGTGKFYLCLSETLRKFLYSISAWEICSTSPQLFKNSSAYKRYINAQDDASGIPMFWNANYLHSKSSSLNIFRNYTRFDHNLLIVPHKVNNFLLKSKNISNILPLPQFTSCLGPNCGHVVTNKYVWVF